MFKVVDYLESLNKIPDTTKYLPLKLQGLSISSKYNYIKSIVNSSEPKIKILSILLQHVDLEVFTKSELENFLEIPNLELIGQSLSIFNRNKTLPARKNLFDTGSPSITNIVDYELINLEFHKEAFSLYRIHSGGDLRMFLRSLVL